MLSSQRSTDVVLHTAHTGRRNLPSDLPTILRRKANRYQYAERVQLPPEHAATDSSSHLSEVAAL